MRRTSKRFWKAPAALLVGAALVSACGGGADPGGECGSPLTFTSSFVYVANNINGAGSLSTYDISATSGALGSGRTPVAAGANPNSVVVAAGGRFAYVANSASGD